MLIAVSFSCMGSYVVLYGYGRGVADMGLFFVVYALCLVVTRPALGSLADRVGTPRVLAFGTVCFAVSYVALFYAQDLPGFLLAAVIGSAGFGCCAPLLQSMGLASVGIDRRRGGQQHHVHGPRFGNACGPGGRGAVAEALAPAARRHHGRLRAHVACHDRAGLGHAGHRPGMEPAGESSATLKGARDAQLHYYGERII